MREATDDRVPNSGGTAAPRIPVLRNACDAHCHILDPRFPSGGRPTPGGATLADYRCLQARLGIRRAVLVQAKHHGADPACLLDGLRHLGADGRGIAVLRPDVADAELARLHGCGVRGLRFSLWNPADAIVDPSMIEPLARRIAGLGWHVQIHMSADQIADHAALLGRLPCPVVFDHMGRLPPDQGTGHPAFRIIDRLVDAGRAWVKLSGAYLDTGLGPPDYADASRVARAFVALAPDRLVWGSDWPHLTEADKPDDAGLLDLLAEWAGDVTLRDRILVDNPAALYGFPA